MASIENRKRSGKDREVKRKRTKDGRIIADRVHHGFANPHG